MKKNFLTIVATLIALTFFGYTGYAVYRENHPIIPKETKTVKVAFQDVDVSAESLIDLADSKGWFRQNGLEIEKTKGIKNISTFLLSGQVDVTISSIGPSLTDFFANKNIKILGMTDRYVPALDIISRYPVDQLDKVKTVAVNRLGGTYQSNFLIIAKSLKGLDPSSVKYVVAADAPITAALLDKGGVDFAFINDNKVTNQLVAEGKYYSIDPAVAFANSYSPFGVITTKEILNDKTDELSKFAAVIKKSYNYFNDQFHKAEMITFLSSKYSLSKEDSERLYNVIMGARKGMNFSPNLDVVKDVADTIKVLNKPVNPNRDLSELLDPRFK